MMHINVDLFKWFINSLMIKLLVEVLKMRNISNKKLYQVLHKPIIRKFKKKKVHSSFIDKI